MFSAREILAKKRDGGELSDEQIRALVRGIATDAVPDYQVSAFLMAAWINGLSRAETVALTREMADCGRRMDFGDLGGRAVDKHSTGGVGDKVSLIVAPLVASCGAFVPMIAGRGLGFTGGTLDKLESIPGLRTDLDADRFERIVREVGCCICGQTRDLAPADRRTYALRDATGTVESIPLITASILSKKLAEGIAGLVLDVKTGAGSLMGDVGRARDLAESIAGVGGDLGLRVEAVLTDMDRPLGRMVGNACEVAEAVQMLRGGGDDRLLEVCVEIGSRMLLFAGVFDSREECEQALTRAVGSGGGLEKLQAMVAAQGGDPSFPDAGAWENAADSQVVKAQYKGYLQRIDARAVGSAVMRIGAGRSTAEDAVDHAAGLEIHAGIGDYVGAGDRLAALHYNRAEGLEEAMGMLQAAFVIGEEPVEPLPVVLEEVRR